MAIKTQTFTGGGGGSITGGLVYKGTFNATTGLPSLANAEQGDYYKIATGGTIYGQTWDINDSLLINSDMGGTITNSKIDKIDNTEPTNVLITTNNLSDLNNAGTARTNLGLGNVATLTTGVSNGNVIVADSTGLPAIDGSQLTNITATDSTKLAIANNLSDLNNATTARTNLGLGNVATLTTGVSNGNVIVADSTGLPAIDGSQLTGVTATDSTKLAIANNLSDLNNATTARTNLGLGNVATLTTGVSNGNVIVADSTGLPAIDGSQLTGVTATDSTKLAIANNLSDLNNAGTARTNLGLGNVATLTTGVANGNVIVADSTGLPAIDGSQLTNITATDSTKLAIANNLSDLNNATTARTNLGLATVASTGAYSDLSGSPTNVSTFTNDAGYLTTAGYPVQTAIGGMDETGTGGSDNSTDINLNSALLLTAASVNDVEVKLPLISTASDGDVAIIVRKNSGSLKISKHDSETVSNPIMYLDAGFGDNFTITNNQQQIHVRFDSAGSGRWYIYDKAQGTAALLNVGTSANQIVQLDGSSRLPAVDGSQLTGVTATDSTKLAIANNLSDLNNAGTARTNLGLGTASTSASTDFLSATGADSLGGNLDVNGNDIVSSSNGDIEIAPDGNGSFIIKGNATSGSGRVVLNCEQNSHGITLKGPPHSAAASYTLTFPNTDGNADQVLKTDGSGNLDWTDQSGGSAPSVTTDSTGSDTTISTNTGIEEIHLISNGSNNVTITIPAASTVGAGYKYNIKRLGTGTVSVAPSSGTIDGASSFSLASQYDSVTLVSDNSNYHII